MKKQIPNSSNSFLFCKSYIHSKIPTDYPQNPWGFITVPIPIPYPCPWESPYPRQPWNSLHCIILIIMCFLFAVLFAVLAPSCVMPCFISLAACIMLRSIVQSLTLVAVHCIITALPPANNSALMCIPQCWYCSAKFYFVALMKSEQRLMGNGILQ